MAETVMLDELKARKGAMDEYKLRIDKMRSENEKLLTDLHKKERDGLEITGFFEEEMRKREEAFKTLQEAYAQAQETWKKEREYMEAVFQQKMKDQADKFDIREQQLMDELQMLRDENSILAEFKENRRMIIERLQNLESELSQAKNRHEEEMRALERKYIAEKIHVEKEAEMKLADLRKRVEEDVVERLDESTKRVLQQNRRMADELKLHVTETEELQRAKKQLEEESRELKREMVISKELTQEWAAKGQKQNKEIRDLQAKIKSLERSLGQMAADFAAEKEKAEAAHSAALEEARTEIAALKKLLKIKGKEFKQVRKLAAEILEQRTEVEAFFLEALDHVRREIGRQRAEGEAAERERYAKQFREASVGKSGVKFPTIRTQFGGEAGASQLPTTPTQKVDIRDLSWEDKERVLRLLFAKINNAQRAPPPQLPPHSFDDPEPTFAAAYPTSTFVTQAPPDMQASAPRFTPTPPTERRTPSPGINGIQSHGGRPPVA
eukprot:tig00001030_g6474.t1